MPCVKKGPPAQLQRVLGPLVILTTVAVLGSSVALVTAGPGQGNWDEIHHMSFLLWLVVMVNHVGSYLSRLPRLLTGKTGEQARSLLAASATRWVLLCGSLAGGAIVAVLAYHLSANWGG